MQGFTSLYSRKNHITTLGKFKLPAKQKILKNVEMELTSRIEFI